MADKLGPFELGRVHCIDCLEAMKELPSKSVQCCVTSPPYWGLRDYQLPAISWPAVEYVPLAGVQPVKVPSCWFGSLGLETTPEMFVGHLVLVFREMWRILQDDGVVWVNLGDSYNGVGRGDKANGLQVAARSAKQRTVSGLKPKDLCGIPWRVAFALQADGWYLRQDVIWSKPNPMPESVTDRCTKSHEYIFLLAKNARYYWDQDAVREPHKQVSIDRAKRNRFGGKYDGADQAEHSGLKMGRNYGPSGDPEKVCSPGGRNPRSVWTITTKPNKEMHFATYPPEIPERCIKAATKEGDVVLDPFAGTATTGEVAVKLGRRFVGFDLSPDYCKIANERMAAVISGITLKEHRAGQTTLFDEGSNP